MSLYRMLREQYKTTRKDLREAERAIRHITGRYPDEFPNRPTALKSRNPASTSAVRSSYAKEKLPISTPTKSETKESTDDEETDGDESEERKGKLQSTVVASMSQGRSRKATIKAQNANSKIKARNRRMFGALIGHIEKFQDEEKKRKPQESMRAKIEQKVEAATKEEREKIKKEKDMLFKARKEKKKQIRCLEKKLERAESHEVYDSNLRHLSHFIQTTAKPQIFFAPRRHTSVTKKCLEKSRTKIKELMTMKKESLEKDLKEIEESYKTVSEPDNSNDCTQENEPCDVLESDSEVFVIEQQDMCIDNEDSEGIKNVDLASDQEFEPIYD